MVTVLRGVMGNRCVRCHRPVPEGMQICKECMEKAIKAAEREWNQMNGGTEKTEEKPQKSVDERLLEYLKLNHTGKEKAVRSKDLERLFSLDQRTIRKKINRIRQNGKPVCSGQTGYFYAECQEDINETVRWLNDLVTSVSNARTGLLFATLIPVPGKVSITIDLSVEEA